MEDVTPELLEALLEEYGKEIETSEIIRFILEKIKEGSATYTDANAFAIEIGSILSKAYGSKISSDVLPNGKMYYNIADRLLRGTLTKSYEDVADVTVRIQEILNEKAKIGIKAIKPEINEDRIKGLIELVSAAEHYDDVGKTLGSSIENYTQSIVDDAIKANVEFHGKSGLSPVISRNVAGNCCAWCARLVGNYSYPDVPKDVYRRHRNCRCTVDYDPGTGKRQNVHTKLWADSEQELEQRKTIGLEKLGLKGNVPNDTMELKDKIADANFKITDLKKQFSDITDGYSYDEWFKDFRSIEEGYGDLTEADEPDVVKLKDISQKLKELIQKKAQWKNQLPVLGGQSTPLSIADALKGANPKFARGTQYAVNCQRCVQTYELRRRGYDVEALPKPKKNNTIVWGNECFVDSSGNTPSFTFNQREKDIRSVLANAPEGSRHIIYTTWKNSRKAHVFIAEKENGIIRFVDPQTNKNNVEDYFSRGKEGRFGILRVDDKDITTDASKIKATVGW